ncbi:hypothetical protein EJB05_40206, partial [Eragrostis curvula]
MPMQFNLNSHLIQFIHDSSRSQEHHLSYVAALLVAMSCVDRECGFVRRRRGRPRCSTTKHAASRFSAELTPQSRSRSSRKQDTTVISAAIQDGLFYPCMVRPLYKEVQEFRHCMRLRSKTWKGDSGHFSVSNKNTLPVTI